MADFKVSKFSAYRGPNFYLGRKALVFNLWLDPRGPAAEHFRESILEKFPSMAESYPDRVAPLFAEVLLRVLKMDIDLYINRYEISRSGDEHVIAVEYLDDRVAEDGARFVSSWFRAMSENRRFDFDGGFLKLQDDFNGTLYGGPTIYSLIEAGLKRDIPVLYLQEENQFMWGYGKKQLRGRSTTFHKDGIKDTEFTQYKDMVKDFLLNCGFPTPRGKNCFTEDDAVKEARRQSFPVVVKPLAGHKGQGVTTNIESEEAVRDAFKKIADGAKAAGVAFDGAIVENQIYGTDHRLLSVNGKFVAALQRVPAYVEGNGTGTIEELIEADNDREVRLDNARSPLCKIKIDDDLKEFLDLQKLSLRSVPEKGKRIYLRRVANISAGGVSINVTDQIHPKNVQLVNDIAKFFNVCCLGIDILAEDIAKPWDEGQFGIIEINAGPGVFMHLAPAIGGSIDVPGKIMEAHFPVPGSERVPIIAGNRLTPGLAAGVYEKLNTLRPGIEFGSLTEEGICFNGKYFFNNPDHDVNIQILLRNPELDFALFSHTKHDLLDFGMIHQGADVIILDNPEKDEEVLARDLLPGGFLIRIGDSGLTVYCDDREIESRPLREAEEKDSVLLDVLDGRLEELLSKYD